MVPDSQQNLCGGDANDGKSPLDMVIPFNGIAREIQEDWIKRVTGAVYANAVTKKKEAL
jgi:hypothetical protein